MLWDNVVDYSQGSLALHRDPNVAAVPRRQPVVDFPLSLSFVPSFETLLNQSQANRQGSETRIAGDYRRVWPRHPNRDAPLADLVR